MTKTLTNIVKNTLLVGGLGTILGCVPVGKGDGIALLTNMNEGLDYVERRDANDIQRKRNDIYAQQNTQEQPTVIYLQPKEESREGKVESGSFKVDNGRYIGSYVWKGGIRVPQGKGIFMYDSGEIYDGDYADGEKNGRGKYTDKEGKVWDGYWKDSKWIRAADSPKPEKSE